MIMKLKVRDKWNISLSIKSDNNNAEDIKSDNNAKNIKIRNIINVKNEDECCLKILNNDFNFAFKLNK